MLGLWAMDEYLERHVKTKVLSLWVNRKTYFGDFKIPGQPVLYLATNLKTGLHNLQSVYG
jgi:hypothetical protein